MGMVVCLSCLIAVCGRCDSGEILNSSIYARWLPPDGDTSFYYEHERPNGGIEYRLVDITTGSSKPMFDHQAILGGC
jgi:hypothetical protein